MKGFASTMSLAEDNFSSSLRMISTAIVEGTDTGGGTETGFKQAGFGQAFLEGIRLTSMDLNKCLHCLSRNLTLKFEVIPFSSSSSSQIMGGTTQSTLVSGLLLEVEEDEDDEDDETDGENGNVGGGFLVLRTAQAVCSFLFSIRSRTMELEAEQ